MNSAQDFVYWLQGFVEIADSDTISEKQWLIIKDHLKLVFDKNTPDRNIEFKPSITFPNQSVKDLIGNKDSNWNFHDYKFPTFTC